MRLIVGILGLLFVVAVAGLSSKRQLAAVSTPTLLPGTSSAIPMAPGSSPAQQSRQLQQQVQQAVEAAIQKPRPTGDEAP